MCVIRAYLSLRVPPLGTYLHTTAADVRTGVACQTWGSSPRQQNEVMKARTNTEKKT
jgi:hypothetical protein